MEPKKTPTKSVNQPDNHAITSIALARGDQFDVTYAESLANDGSPPIERTAPSIPSTAIDREAALKTTSPPVNNV